MQTPGSAPPRSALLTAWGNAWLAGEAALTELVERVCVMDDDHAVTGLWVDDLPLEQAVARLRADGVQRLRLVLPAPGDVVGLPGPGPFTSAALTASEAALALRPDGSGTGLVPTVTAHGTAFDGTVTTVLWSAYDISGIGPDPGPFLHDAEHDLRRGVLECVELLRELDVARWRPEVAGALQDLRAQARRGIEDDELPGSYPIRARQLLIQARQLGGVLSLATVDAGGAVDTRETAARELALRGLEQLVRRARVAAYNAHGLPVVDIDG
ncbi:MAG: hypothetical protein QOE05_69 [Actinomycetota bacterium]|nr:hypothetical protein [Actinomycetota bacterium]